MPTSETISWADGFLLVYSITDRQSFNWVKQCRLHICEKRNSMMGLSSRDRGGGISPPLTSSNTQISLGGEVASTSGAPMVLVGNKADMVHLRQVSAEEGNLTKHLY